MLSVVSLVACVFIVYVLNDTGDANVEHTNSFECGALSTDNSNTVIIELRAILLIILLFEGEFIILLSIITPLYVDAHLSNVVILIYGLWTGIELIMLI